MGVRRASIQARRVLSYLEGLTCTQGHGAGEPFRVLPWERRFVVGALADGVGEAALTVARKAGKTTLTAAIAAAYLDGDGVAGPASEIAVVSATLKQSRRLFRHVLRFLDAAGRLGRYRKQDTVNQASLESLEDGRTLDCLGANPGGLHGGAPALILADEVAQWPKGKVDAMLAALRTSLGGIPGSRLILLGTRAATSAHPFALALKTSDYVQVHAARDGDPPFWKRTWQRANPSLRYFPALEEQTRREARKARGNPEALAAFRALRLNLGVADVLESVLIEAETWAAIEGEADAAGPCVWGVDLGGTAAQSAVSAYWPGTGRLDVLAAFPSRPTLAERGLRDGVGSLYRDMARRGELTVHDGHAVDVSRLLRDALDRFGRPVAVAADRWREGELRDGLEGAGVPMASLSLRGMGYRDGGADVRAFRRAIAEGKVAPRVSLLLRAAMAEARTVSDPAGNAKLAKQREGGRRERARDDAAAAAILAVAEGVRRGAVKPVRRRRYAVAR